MKKLLVVLMAVMCLFSLTACGGDTAEKKEAIIIGGSGPISEVAAQYGQAVNRGAQIAVDEINALGGLQFYLDFQDDNHDTEKARTAYDTLKDHGMQVSIGTVTTAPGEEVAADYKADDIFAISPSASGPKVTELGDGNVFQMCFSDPNQGKASADYIVEHNLASKIGIIYNDGYDYSIGIYEKFIAEAETKNLEIVCTTTYNDDNATDFTTQISKCQQAGAELVFLPMYYDAAATILKQSNDAGYEPIFFGVDGMDGVITALGDKADLAEGVYLLTPFSADATDEKTVNFVSKYEELYGETPIQFAADAYDCIYAIYQACTNGNVTYDMSASDIAAIMREQFTTMTFEGVTGTTTWNAAGEADKTPRAVIIENGVYVEK